MTNVKALPGINLTTEVNQALIEVLEGMLDMARSGKIVYFAGISICSDGDVLQSWAGEELNEYVIIGALDVLRDDIKDDIFDL